MLVLFDHSVPAPLSPFLSGHTITEARTRGWDTLSNGDLLPEAERTGFDVFLIADKNIRYQQILTARRIAVVANGAGSIAHRKSRGGAGNAACRGALGCVAAAGSKTMASAAISARMVRRAYSGRIAIDTAAPRSRGLLID